MGRWSAVLAALGGAAVGAAGALFLTPRPIALACDHASVTPLPAPVAQAGQAVESPADPEPANGPMAPDSAAPAPTTPLSGELLNGTLASLVGEALVEYAGMDFAFYVNKKIVERLRERGPAALTWLRAQAADGSSPFERSYAISLLAQLQDHDAVALLAESLRIDPAPQVRSAAASALRFLGTHDEAPTLLDALQSDPDPGVRGAAAWGVARLGGPEAVARLIQVLEEDSDSGVCIAVTNAMSGVDSKEAVAALMRLAEDSPDADVRTVALYHLVQARRPEARPLLLKGSQGREFEMRVSCLSGLAALGDDRALDRLLAEYAGAGADLPAGCSAVRYRRKQIMWSLSESEHPRAAAALRTILATETDEEILDEAINRVQDREDVEALPLLDRIAATHPDACVREAAERARNQIRERIQSPE